MSPQPSRSRFKRLIIGSAAACLVLAPVFFFLFNPPKKSVIKVPIASRPAKIITVKILDNRTASEQVGRPPAVDIPARPASSVAERQAVENIPPAPLRAPSVQPAPLPEQMPAIAAVPAPEEKIAPAIPPEPTQAAPVALQAQKTEASQTPILVIKNESQDRIKRENWLQTQDPSRYTIQVIGVRSEATLLRFIAENSPVLSNRELAYYRSAFKSHDWFPLLYGIYESKKDARLALDGLPENIRQHSPWVRTLSAVQSDINRHKNP